MDPAIQALVTYLKQNSAAPRESLRALCLKTGYTNEQFDTAYAEFVPDQTAPKQPSSSHVSSNPSDPIPTISVDPIANSSRQKPKMSIIQVAFSLVNSTIIISTAIIVIASLATAAYLISSSGPK